MTTKHRKMRNHHAFISDRHPVTIEGETWITDRYTMCRPDLFTKPPKTADYPAPDKTDTVTGWSAGPLIEVSDAVEKGLNVAYRIGRHALGLHNSASWNALAAVADPRYSWAKGVIVWTQDRPGHFRQPVAYSQPRSFINGEACTALLEGMSEHYHNLGVAGL